MLVLWLGGARSNGDWCIAFLTVGTACCKDVRMVGDGATQRVLLLAAGGGAAVLAYRVSDEHCIGTSLKARWCCFHRPLALPPPPPPAARSPLLPPHCPHAAVDSGAVTPLGAQPRTAALDRPAGTVVPGSQRRQRRWRQRRRCKQPAASWRGSGRFDRQHPAHTHPQPQRGDGMRGGRHGGCGTGCVCV